MPRYRPLIDMTEPTEDLVNRAHKRLIAKVSVPARLDGNFYYRFEESAFLGLNELCHPILYRFFSKKTA